jgi:hypothetical protein
MFFYQQPTWSNAMVYLLATCMGAIYYHERFQCATLDAQHHFCDSCNSDVVAILSPNWELSGGELKKAGGVKSPYSANEMTR